MFDKNPKTTKVHHTLLPLLHIPARDLHPPLVEGLIFVPSKIERYQVALPVSHRRCSVIQ